MTGRVDVIATDGGAPAAGAPPRRRWIRWTKKLKGQFLDRLAETSNVVASARAVGVDPTTVHHLRRRDAAFAADWEAALAAGYVMLETRLVGHILAGGTRYDPIDAAGGHTEAIVVEDALRALAARDARDARLARGQMGKGGARPARATPEETNAAILKQLRIIDRRERKD